MLKGTGTLASKSRLTALGRAESSFPQPLFKGEEKIPLASSWERSRKKKREKEKDPTNWMGRPSVWTLDFRSSSGWGEQEERVW